MSTLELAWAAGFFDGEGSTCISQRSGYKSVRMTISQCERSPLERFQAAVGCGRIYGPYARTVRDQMYWQVSAIADVRRVSRLLEPYLCQPKLDQMYRTMAEYDAAQLLLTRRPSNHIRKYEEES